MIDNPSWDICERISEVQASFDDHVGGGMQTAAAVLAKARAVLSDPELLESMSQIGYAPRPPRRLSEIGLPMAMWEVDWSPPNALPPGAGNRTERTT